jgi:hypothetical protein
VDESYGAYFLKRKLKGWCWRMFMRPRAVRSTRELKNVQQSANFDRGRLSRAMPVVSKPSIEIDAHIILIDLALW